MKKSAGFLLFLSLVAGFSCKDKRNTALRQLFQEGVVYLKEIRAALEKSQTVTAATDAIEKSLPQLEKLVERKKNLEKEYPELRDQLLREKLHLEFPEFQHLRDEMRAFMDYGQNFLDRYKNNERFLAAVRKGVGLLSYF